jgi:hypothetical protein
MFTVRTMQSQCIQNAALLTVKADGSYSYHSALKGNTGVITQTPMWRTCYEEVCYKFRPWGNLLFIVSESKRDDNSVMFAARRQNPIQTGGTAAAGH